VIIYLLFLRSFFGHILITKQFQTVSYCHLEAVPFLLDFRSSVRHKKKLWFMIAWHQTYFYTLLI